MNQNIKVLSLDLELALARKARRGRSVGEVHAILTYQVGQQEPRDVAAQDGQKCQYPTAQQAELEESGNSIKFLLHGRRLGCRQGIRWKCG